MKNSKTEKQEEKEKKEKKMKISIIIEEDNKTKKYGCSNEE